MYQDFETIEQFTKFKETCYFCQSKLHVRLATFTQSIPILNAALQDNKFSFKLSRVTQEYALEAGGLLDIKTNILNFNVPTDSQTPAIDKSLAKEIFENLRPNIELFCPNRKCIYQYHVCTSPLRCNALAYKEDGDWIIKPPRLWYEGFVEKKLVIHNDYALGTTVIYARNNELAEPLSTPMLDWQAMGKDKLLTRIRTLVTFS